MQLAQTIADLNPLMSVAHLVSQAREGTNAYGKKMSGMDIASKAADLVPFGSAANAGRKGLLMLGKGVGRLAGGTSVTARARALGIAGEKAVGLSGAKTAIKVGGRTRIPDALTRRTLTEVKNVKSLSFTRQLRDFHSFSQQTGRQFILYTRPGTTLSGPLRNAINQGTITHRFIPGL